MTPQELKNSILQLAIQGKLVKQDACEKVDFAHINSRKNAVIEECDFEIPDTWCIGTIESICETIPTKQYQILEKEVRPAGKYPVISQSKEYQIGFSDNEDKVCKVDEAIIAFGDHTTVVKYIDFDFIVGADGVKLFKPNESIYFKYLFYALQILTSGLDKIGGYSRHYKFIKNKPIPIPPLAEQKRIVAKIEELLPYIDRYEQAWNKLEDFNKRFPVDMQKSILQTAIQGKLVEQCPEEGTGEELYRQIQAEKQRLVKERKIKKEKPLPEIAEDEVPFDIPKSWKWCHLSSLSSKITDGEHKTPRRVFEFCGFYLLSARNVRDGSIQLSNVDYVDSEEYGNISKRCNPQRGDILLSCSGSVGRCAVISDDNKYVMVRSAAMVSPIILDSQYLMYCIQSSVVQEQIRNKIKQTAQANLFQTAICSILIPLPPLAEQKRIVAKLEDLLPLCERLK